MKEYKTDLMDLRCMDCMDLMREMPDNSVDSIVTDPPYGLSFMGKKWDYDVPSEEIWRECLRVLKPGGHLLAFAGTRTQHRMAVRIEDAGFEIRDMIAWVYGSGFPKSLDVSKAIDKAAGAEREVVGTRQKLGLGGSNTFAQDKWTQSQRGIINLDITAPATEAAKQWQGWGTALKPALEPITVARKPFNGTVAANVLEHGTGGLNIDGCRVGTNGETPKGSGNPCRNAPREAIQPGRNGGNGGNATPPEGRWPANLIHDGSDEVVGLFPQAPSAGKYKKPDEPKEIGARGADWSQHIFRAEANKRRDNSYAGDTGSAARFFYCAKASKKDRDEGCEGLEARTAGECTDRTEGSGGLNSPRAGAGRTSGSRNHHPTVKPTALMRYLCRLVTPPGGLVLDPFMGSGSTGKAAVLEGFRFVGAEMNEEYFPIAVARISAVPKQVKTQTAQQELTL